MKGERLSRLVSSEALKLAAGAVLLSPFIPLIFMGEEYRETVPFPYFIDHEDPKLVESVREGRQKEFISFHWEGAPPDPKAENTFRSDKLNHGSMRLEKQRNLFEQPHIGSNFSPLSHFRMRPPCSLSR